VSWNPSIPILLLLSFLWLGCREDRPTGLPANARPVANAGVDQIVERGATVTLDGNGSSDADGDPLSCWWTAPAGIHLSDPAATRPTFAAQALGTHRITLVAGDGRLGSLPDTVVVTVVRPRFSTSSLPQGATMEFAWIEAGSFMMGSPESDTLATPDERPQHPVILTEGFYLGRCEITQGQWQAVMRAPGPWRGRTAVQIAANNPASYLSWNDLQAMVHALNQAAGDSLYRLPTEAEWEYACRAGTTTAWSFGEEEEPLRDYAWYWDTAWDAGRQSPQPVGAKLPNPWGLYDMHGNLWEWVQDGWGSYGPEAQTDPTGPAKGPGGYRVARGGFFRNRGLYTRSAVRLGLAPNERGLQAYGQYGGRLVMIDREQPPE
jgi:formylglycine-generating enzyme required for sulfatase activity